MASGVEHAEDLRTPDLPQALAGQPRPRRGILVRARRSALPALIPLAASCGLWVWSLRGVDPRAMGALGLLSILPWTAYAALAVLVVSFALTLVRPHAPAWAMTLHIVAFVTLIHGTPALLYGTLRYSWAWKHAGIVDYIDRFGGVDPLIAHLSVYHNWPGFFALNALVTRAAGLDSALSYASWAPLFFNLLYLAGVAMAVRALTSDRRTIALSAWIFALANWVGQDYFAPQALSFMWYLVVLAVLLRWFAARPPALIAEAPSVAARDGLLFAVLLLLFSIASTHQLTPFNMIFALTALVVFNHITPRTLPVLMIVLTAGWLLFVADTFVPPALAEVIETLGHFGDNLNGKLIEYHQATAGPILVSRMAKGLSVAVAVLAMLGAARSFRRGDRYWPAVLLWLSPAVAAVVTSYGDEARLRLFLFALPFLAFFAAALVHPPNAPVHRGRTAAATIAVSGVLLAGFLYAYFGNERIYYFTAGEVAAAEYIHKNAPPRSLLIEGSSNYPTQFRNYERFTYVRISLEPLEARRTIIADPAGVLSRWMSNDRYAATYLIITRAQKAETDSFGYLPPGGLAKVEQALRESPEFELVYSNADASVFTLAQQPGAPQ